MRRDICRVFTNDVESVYAAYEAAAKEKFGKDCKEEPYHTLQFGLNFSFKYNMNGGSCIVHVMPYNGGTAVDVRYTIAQLLGARYKAHEADMQKVVAEKLGGAGQIAQIPVEEFLKPENQVKKSE